MPIFVWDPPCIEHISFVSSRCIKYWCLAPFSLDCEIYQMLQCSEFKVFIELNLFSDESNDFTSWLFRAVTFNVLVNKNAPRVTLWFVYLFDWFAQSWAWFTGFSVTSGRLDKKLPSTFIRTCKWNENISSFDFFSSIFTTKVKSYWKPWASY